MNKEELIKLLKEEYEMSDSELKNGSNYKNKKDLEDILAEKESLLDSKELVEEDKDDDLDDFFDKDIQKQETKGFKDNDEIVVMSGINGDYTHRSVETGRAYRFKGFGQTSKMPYKELLNIRNLYPKVLDDGWLIILNKDLINEFGYTEMYRHILTPNSMKKIFEKSTTEMMDMVRNMPKGMKTTFLDLARSAYRNGTLDRISVVNAIQDEFNISLEDNAPIEDTE